MRSLVLALVLAACGGSPAPRSTLPIQTPTVAPASDLAQAKQTAPREVDGKLIAKDPRIVDLDISRITASSRGVGGEPEMDHVSTADLFKQATDAAKGGETERAISIYRRLVTDFPDSKYAPVSLFNIAAIHDGRNDLPATIATLRELVKAYPDARESVDGHLYIAALQADHDQHAEALATIDEILPRTQLTYADRIEAYARRGYSLIELHRYEEAQTALDTAVGEWRKAPKIEDPYYIAMASYYRGELAHR
jgi:TolA-binding protein